MAGWWWALIKIQIMNLWFECLNYQYYIFYIPRFDHCLMLELATGLGVGVEQEIEVNFFTSTQGWNELRFTLPN